MSTEEKAIKNTEKTETPKPKRRFKLDKKHIQGFIAGILLCAIAFTGLHYVTDGWFFKGTMSYEWTFVTDATFEDEVIKSEIPVLVVFYSQRNGESLSSYKVAADIAKYYVGIIKFAFVDVNKVPEVTAQYLVNTVPTCYIFKDGEAVRRKVGLMSAKQLGDWLKPYY